MFLIDDVFNAIANHKKANAAKAAWEDQQRYNKEKAEADTQTRNLRYEGISNLLGNVQPFLHTTNYSRGGNVSGAAPNYTMDPALLAKKEAVKIPVAPVGPDPSQGADWAGAGQVVKGLGDLAMDYFMGGFKKPNPQAKATPINSIYTTPGEGQPGFMGPPNPEAPITEDMIG